MIVDKFIDLTDKLVEFPIFGKNGKPTIKLDISQITAIEKYEKTIEEEEYEYEKVDCLCKRATVETDVILANKDRYGIKVSFILCKKCGLIRVDNILKEKHLHHFYEFFYRPIYNPVRATPEYYFNNELTQGRKFLGLIKKHANPESIRTIFETGCGSGGILYPFKELTSNLKGCDFDVEFLQYGIDKGLSLSKGTAQDAQLANKSIDLFILSHVLEHIIDPIDELQKINPKIAIGGYLLIEVPGTGQLHRGIFPRFFQNIHLYIYHQKLLEEIVVQLGYKMIYGNEDVTLIFQKVKEISDSSEITISEYEAKARYIMKYMKFSFLYYYSPFNKHKLIRNTRRKTIRLLDYFNLRNKIKNILGKV